jgi:hypothetical protein
MHCLHQSPWHFALNEIARIIFRNFFTLLLIRRLTFYSLLGNKSRFRERAEKWWGQKLGKNKVHGVDLIQNIFFSIHYLPFWTCHRRINTERVGNSAALFDFTRPSIKFRGAANKRNRISFRFIIGGQLRGHGEITTDHSLFAKWRGAYVTAFAASLPLTTLLISLIASLVQYNGS